jgi:aspartyl-tRNA(Asn)/glutamyl-tRNA(Gln) amidotransferase subunit B
VSAYLERLCEMFRYAEISDCKMQEGSLRADVNISVRPMGEKRLGTRTELKNLNSFKAIERAIAYESARQIRVIEEGGVIEQETRRWDDAAGVSLGMRSKENAQDYRYFPEPDLPPLNLSTETVEKIRCELPEFAHDRVLRFEKEYGLTAYDAKILCTVRSFADLFEKTVQAGVEPKSCSNWMLGPVKKILNDRGAEEGEITLSPAIFAALITHVNDKKINRSAAITLLEELLLCVEAADIDLERLIEARGLAQLSDGGAIAQTVAEVFAKNPAALDDYRAGKKRAEGFLIGQTMKALGGRADPVAVKQAVSAALVSIE